MIPIRKRGLIALLATLPLWVVVFVVAWQYDHRTFVPWRDNNAVPIVGVGAVQSIIIVTLAALGILAFDLLIWIRGRNGRRN